MKCRIIAGFIVGVLLIIALAVSLVLIFDIFKSPDNEGGHLYVAPVNI